MTLSVQATRIEDQWVVHRQHTGGKQQSQRQVSHHHDTVPQKVKGHTGEMLLCTRLQTRPVCYPFGRSERSRSSGLLSPRQALFQLSYTSTAAWECFGRPQATGDRLKPLTLCDRVDLEPPVL